MRRVLSAGALVALTLLASAPAWAQLGQLRGKVVGPDGKPIADAKVLIEFHGGVNRKFEVKTSKDGDYVQMGLEPGPYRVTASKEGLMGGYADVRVGLGDEATQAPQIRLEKPKVGETRFTEEELRKKFAKGVQLNRDGKLDEAEVVFKELAEEFPEIPEVHQNLGIVYSQKKQWPEAEASLLKALELRPGDKDTTTALATLYHETGQSEKAMELMGEMAEANPGDAQSQYNHGVFLLNAGKTPEALAAFESAVTLDPGLAEAHYLLGTLLVGQGKIPEAIEHLEQYLSMNPDNQQNIATAQGLLQALKK